ncbi:MAG: hypothetical protein GWP05_02645 [Anaerolineaceae bacterium]|nr:hypothetical protein [Anaerolineaceae bacterium]
MRYVGVKMFAVLLGLAAVALSGCGEAQLLDESEEGLRLPLADVKRPVLSDVNPSTPYTAETAEEMDVADPASAVALLRRTGDPGRPTPSAGGVVTNTADRQPLQPEAPRYRADLDKALADGGSEPAEPPGATGVSQELTISEEGQRLKVVNLIVAEVNGEIITREDLVRPIRGQMAQWSKVLEEKEFEARVRLELSTRLRAEISRQLALQEAKKQAREEHIKYFDKEIEKKRQRLVAMSGGSMAKWRQKLAAAGLTEDQWRQNAVDRMMVQYFLNEAIGPKISVTRQELLDYYERVKQERYQPKTQARMQLIRLRRQDYASAEAVLSLARSLVRRARSGEDFAAWPGSTRLDPEQAKGDSGRVSARAAIMRTPSTRPCSHSPSARCATPSSVREMST